VELSNLEYKIRFDKLHTMSKMKRRPRCGRIFDGYAVVRKLGMRDRYETWMPGDVFDDLYRGVPPRAIEGVALRALRADTHQIVQATIK
jgi:hypothetical protein